ncbi:MAG TPA: ClpX C4-type zinc finger protein [Actinomycetes bacterium]|nr:ClpX C4-type zinc finger protein [Actinomycetes bacterium]
MVPVENATNADVVMAWSSESRERREGTEQPHHNDYVYALKDEEAYLQADDKKLGIVEPVDSIVCQFCGKFSEQVAGGLFQAKHLARDPNTSALTTVWICDECVARMAQVLAEESPGTQWMRGWQFWSRRGRAPDVP